MGLNYSALEVSRPKRRVSDLTDIPKLDNFVGTIFMTAIIFLFLSQVFIQSLVLLPLVFFLLYRATVRAGYSSTRLSNFAVDNGFTYHWGIKGQKLRRIQFGGVIGASSPTVAASNMIQGKYKDFNFMLFNPLFKGNFTVMRVELKNNYPHIVLDSRVKSPLFGNIGKFFSEKSRIHLEGDFNNYFKVYAKAAAVDTLRILTPDMMALLIDSGHKYDIEIFENNLHIISDYKHSNRENVESFFVVADILLDKLDRRLVTRQAVFDSASHVA